MVKWEDANETEGWWWWNNKIGIETTLPTPTPTPTPDADMNMSHVLPPPTPSQLHPNLPTKNLPMKAYHWYECLYLPLYFPSNNRSTTTTTTTMTMNDERCSTITITICGRQSSLFIFVGIASPARKLPRGSNLAGKCRLDYNYFHVAVFWRESSDSIRSHFHVWRHGTGTILLSK